MWYTFEVTAKSKRGLEWTGAVIAALALLCTVTAAVWTGGREYGAKVDTGDFHKVDVQVHELAVQVRLMADTVISLQTEQRELRNDIVALIKEIK